MGLLVHIQLGELQIPEVPWRSPASLVLVCKDLSLLGSMQQQKFNRRKDGGHSFSCGGQGQPGIATKCFPTGQAQRRHGHQIRGPAISCSCACTELDPNSDLPSGGDPGPSQGPKRYVAIDFRGACVGPGPAICRKKKNAIAEGRCPPRIMFLRAFRQKIQGPINTSGRVESIKFVR